MYVDNPFESPALLSFCPGFLGLERGIERAIGKIRVAAYVEIEAFIIANLVAGMEAGMVDPAPIWTDAKTFDARPFRGRIHGIIGGYPCPGESLAGLREGHLYKGFLWPAIRRAIAAARPLWCFFENVDDHLTGTYPIVLRSLRNMGYRVEAGVFSAEEVGAPHERKRLFILAVSTALGNTQINRFHSGAFGDDKREWLLATHQSGTNEGVWDKSGGSGIGKELADTNSNGTGTRPGQITGTRGKIEGEEHGQQWDNEDRQRMRVQSGLGGETLADPDNSGGKQNWQSRELRTAGPKQSSGNSGVTQQRENGEGGRYRWPAGAGPFQYPWEEKRTIESGLGCTVDGYNFRADLLRAFGNSVVEQTAELAFITLLEKHSKYNYENKERTEAATALH